MGMLRRKSAVDGVFLKSETRIGRERDNDIVIARPSISARHATVSWTTTGWVLKDTSRHGTLLNGSLVKGATCPVVRGDVLTFAEVDESWTIESSDPPGLLLHPQDHAGQPIHIAPDEGLRAFPSDAAPSQTLLYVNDGWFLEADSGARRRLVNGSAIELDDVAYTVFVPIPLVETEEPKNPATPWSLDTARFEIRVLRGEDEAEVVIRAGATSRVVKPSRPLYLLAYLAEHRAKAVSVGDGEDGWIPAELACVELGVDRTALNVDVHRIREALKSTGLLNAANIVERRTSQIRIGVSAARYEVTRG